MIPICVHLAKVMPSSPRKLRIWQRLYSPIVQLESAFNISIATNTAVMANPKISVACRFASSSLLSNWGLSFASTANRSSIGTSRRLRQGKSQEPVYVKA
jgi:hypothetical protein